jgi:hypothetical protein
MFENARLKLDRAKHHIRDLQLVFASFIRDNPDPIRIEHDAAAGMVTARIIDPDFPASLPLIIGDAIHNLRTALDHAMWELIRLDGGTQDRWTAFPAHRRRVDYEAACNGIKTPRNDTRKFLISLACHEHGGGEKIYGLHILDNSDKHAIITPTVGTAMGHEISLFAESAGGEITWLGAGGPGSRSLTAATTSGVKFHHNSKVALDIFFADVEFFPHRAAIPTLMHLTDAVEDVLRQFEIFVRSRP